MGKVLTKELQAKLEANSAELMSGGASEEEIQQMAFAFVEQFGVDEKKKIEPTKSGSSLSGNSNTENTKTGVGYFQSPQSKGIALLRGKSVKPTSEYVQSKKVDNVIPEQQKNALENETFKVYKKTKLIPESVKKSLGDDRAFAIIKNTNWDDIDEPTKYNLSKEERDAKIAESSADDLITNYSKGVVYAPDAKQFIQSREGKVGSLLKKVQDGAVLGANDVEYLSKNAGKAWSEIQDVVKQNNAYDENNPAQSISNFYKSQRQKQLQDYYGAAAMSTLNEVKSLGVDLNKLNDASYMASSVAKIGQMYSDKLDELNLKYPETVKYESRGTHDFRKVERSPEYYKEKEAIDEMKQDVLNKLGFASAVDFAVKNPTKTSEEVGEVYMSIANPERYKAYVNGGKKSDVIKAELSKMGISALLGNGNENSAVIAMKDDVDFNLNYPKQKTDEVLHKIGAEYYKSQKGGRLLSSILMPRPTIQEMDKISLTQLSDEDREWYNKYIRPVEMKLVASTNVPLSGFINKGTEAVSDFASNTIKGVQNLTGFRSDEETLNDALNGVPIARQSVGEYELGKQRLKQLESKKNLSFDEINELNKLKEYVGVRSNVDKLSDDMGNVTGQVLAMAAGTKGIGGLLTKGASKLGILAETAGEAATLEEAMAGAINEIGVSEGTLYGGVANALAFTSSYDQAEGEFMQLNPDAPAWKRKLYASGVGVLNMVTERMFKDEKIFDAFNKEVKPSLATLFNNLTEAELKNLTQAQITSKVKNVLITTVKKAADFGKAWAKNVNEEAIEEVATSVGTSAMVALLAPNKFNAKEALDDAVTTYQDMAIGGLLVGGMGANADVKRNRIASNAIYQIGADPAMADNLRSLIATQVADGKLTQADAIKKNQIINTAQEVVTKNIPIMEEVRPLTQDEKNKLTVLTLSERELQSKIGKEEYADVKDVLEEQLNEIKAERTKLLKKELVLDDKFNLVTIDEYNANRQQPVLVVENGGKFEVNNPNGKVEVFDTQEKADARVVEINNESQTTNNEQQSQTPSAESATTIGQVYTPLAEESTTENAQPISEAQAEVGGVDSQVEDSELVIKKQAQENKSDLVKALNAKQKAEYIKEKRAGRGDEYLIDKLYNKDAQKWEVEGIDKVEQQSTTSNQSEIEFKNEGKAEAPTLENIDSRLRLGHPFYEKLSDALDKLGLIKKYNPETKEGDIIGGFSQKTSDGGFQVGKIEFKKDGSITYIDGNNLIEVDKNGNVISENTKEVKAQETQNTIKSLKESISSFENLRDSEAFKYKEVTQTDPLGRKTKVKVLKTEQELKASTDKINAQIEKSKAELKALEQQSIQENERTTATGATSEPIREKATGQGQAEKGVGQAVQQGNDGVGQVGATKSTTVLENTSRIQTSDAIRDAYGSLEPTEIQKLVDSGKVEEIPVSEDFSLYKVKGEVSPNFKDYGGDVESAKAMYQKDKAIQEETARQMEAFAESRKKAAEPITKATSKIGEFEVSEIKIGDSTIGETVAMIKKENPRKSQQENEINKVLDSNFEKIFDHLISLDNTKFKKKC